MKLKVLQNYREESGNYFFEMAIVDDKGYIITNNEDVKAIARFKGNDEDYDFQEPLEDISYTFDACLENSTGWIGSVDYRKQCLCFLKTFNENFEEIDNNSLDEKKKAAKKEIERLEKILNEESMFYEKIESIKLYNDNANRRKWILNQEEKLKDVVEGSETYKEIIKRIERYKEEIYES